jgi:ABC-type lipoprotein export system ATPase subunit
MNEAVAPIVEIVGLEKQHAGLRPLRIARLAIAPGDRYTVSGLDQAAAEAFVHLVTGALLPDAGDIRVDGRSTRDIVTDTEWLVSLDRFGIVTERAVLLDGLSVAANLALPLTLAIDPMLDEMKVRVARMADEVEIAGARLDAQLATLSPAERVRVHLARALAVNPAVLLLEHPTARLDDEAAEALGTTLKAISSARGLAWIAITEHERFARATGATRLKLRGATGELVKEGRWRWS